ncbi:ABC transporter substrate-binding protein [Brucellaceae bacterium D45D]
MRSFIASIGIMSAMLAATPAQSADITLEFWHYQTANRDVMVEMINDFEKANPDIDVREHFKDNANMVSEIQAAAMAGRQPDIAQVLGRLVVGLTQTTKPVALDETSAGPEIAANIAPNFLAIGSYEGHTYAVPHSFGTPIVYINKDLFQKAGLDPNVAPRDWQQVREFSRVITEKTGSKGLFIAQGGRDVAPQQIMVNAGAKMLTDDFSAASFATQDAIDAMQLVQDMALEDKSISVLSDRENTALFNAGKIGMYVNSVAVYKGVVRDTAGVFELGVGNFPVWKDKPRQVPNSGAALMAFSESDKQKQAAARFIAYMTKPENTNRWAIVSGYLPVSPTAKNAEVIKAQMAADPLWAVAVNQMDDLVSTARWPGSRVVDIQIVLENMMQAVLQGKGKAAELVPAAEKDVTRLISEGSF